VKDCTLGVRDVVHQVTLPDGQTKGVETRVAWTKQDTYLFFFL